MSICVEILPDNTLSFTTAQCDYILLTYSEAQQLQNSVDSLAADSPEVQQLLAAIIGLLALAWVFRETVNFIFNKK
ncbi:hypothetical protein [Methylophaga thalassica]|uniref:hypothetical protein n=1 Tax=Methylophaga thalassica TaxID=40223 RepID=UPI002E7BAF8F|nr:hypothetical protein [Methylophaga thalassica]WVI84157.1 hypothetical protein VSX76_10255 [Methylophaga thalassica]